MLSEEQAKLYVKPLRLMFSMRKDIPNVVIALNTNQGLENSELEEFNVENFRRDPLYATEIYMRHVEYIESGLKPDCYMLGTWAQMHMIPIDKYPSHLSEDEVLERRDEFAEAIEIYQVSFFMKGYMSTLTLKPVNGTLDIMYPPGFVEEDNIRYVKDSTQDIIALFQSLFELV